MSRYEVDSLLDHQIELTKEIKELKQQLATAKGQITKLKNKETK